MRITNTMMTNNILLSLNKNRKVMADYEEQLSTGKRIQKPSDDPIVAARALKFRTNISEIDQYKTNTNDALSWISVTEQAVSNTSDIMKRIHELSVQAATGTLTTANRESTISEISQLREQIANEGNASYAGRYIFTGYQTNSSLVFDEPMTDSYEISETLGTSHVETVNKVFDDPSGNPSINQVSRIRLGYDTVIPSAVPGTIPGFTVATLLSTSTAPAPEAYNPPVTVPPTAYFLQDTGELIFNTGDVASIPASFSFTYQKDVFKKGDVKPDHYFDSTHLASGNTFTKTEESMDYQVSYSQNIQVNVMGYDLVTNDLLRDLDELIANTKKIAKDGTLEDELRQDLLQKEFGSMIGKMDDHLSNNININAEIGGKVNRLELTLSRLQEDRLNFTDLLSENEDIDMAEVLIKFSAQEVVYNAALSSSSKVIQPTLLDFMR